MLESEQFCRIEAVQPQRETANFRFCTKSAMTWNMVGAAYIDDPLSSATSRLMDLFDEDLSAHEPFESRFEVIENTCSTSSEKTTRENGGHPYTTLGSQFQVPRLSNVMVQQSESSNSRPTRPLTQRDDNFLPPASRTQIQRSRR